MRSLKLGLAATAVICALSATAQADCVKVAAVGEAVTHDIAVLFSTHGLANVIYGQGRVGKGPVHTKCEDRLKYDDVSLLADGVQSDDTQNLLRRLALLLTPLLGANSFWSWPETGWYRSTGRSPDDHERISRENRRTLIPSP